MFIEKILSYKKKNTYFNQIFILLFDNKIH